MQLTTHPLVNPPIKEANTAAIIIGKWGKQKFSTRSSIIFIEKLEILRTSKYLHQKIYVHKRTSKKSNYIKK
jgi:hypothetical protein